MKRIKNTKLLEGVKVMDIHAMEISIEGATNDMQYKVSDMVCFSTNNYVANIQNLDNWFNAVKKYINECYTIRVQVYNDIFSCIKDIKVYRCYNTYDVKNNVNNDTYLFKDIEKKDIMILMKNLISDIINANNEKNIRLLQTKLAS